MQSEGVGWARPTSFDRFVLSKELHTILVMGLEFVVRLARTPGQDTRYHRLPSRQSKAYRCTTMCLLNLGFHSGCEFCVQFHVSSPLICDCLDLQAVAQWIQGRAPHSTLAANKGNEPDF